MHTQIGKFHVIGISTRTTNENYQAAQDIPALWHRFTAEGIMEKIPNKTDDAILSIYTEYEKDYMKPYTTILGCRVSSLDNIPEGMVGITIKESNYLKFVANGNLMEGIIFQEWVKIWKTDLNRKYIADFEVYSEKSKDTEHAEVEIFVGVA